MKKTLFSVAAALTIACGSMFTVSCDLGTAGSTIGSAGTAIASTALQNYLTTGKVSGGGTLAASALQTIIKDKNMANMLGSLAANIIQNYTQKGTPVTYTGSSQVEALSGTYEPMAYNTIGKNTINLDVVLTGNQKDITKATTAMLTIPAYTIAQGIKTSEMTIAGLDLTHNGMTTNIALGNSSGFSGTPTLTVNGQAFNAATVYITEAKVVGNQLTLNMTLYYGTNYTNPINLVYVGAVK